VHGEEVPMTIERTPDDLQALEREVVEARAEFMAALEQMDPALLTAPGLLGEWSARELLAHLGYWAGLAAEALHAASEDRTESFGADDLEVDERNAVVARVASETELATVRQREQAAYEALLEALRGADPAWLEERVSYGDSLEQVVRDDGAEHYREHAADIRAWFSGADDEAELPE
jgi:hypothetical protein